MVIELGEIALRRMVGGVQLRSSDPLVTCSLVQVESDSGTADPEIEEIVAEGGVEASDLPTGKYEATWSFAGIELAVDRVLVKSGETTELGRRFDPVQFTVISDPPNATVQIEGEDQPRGVTPLVLSLRPGHYSLKANIRDWEGKKLDVLVKSE